MNNRKSRKNSGETLIETLCAILVISLASVMFFTAAISSGKINTKVAKEDSVYRDKVDTAEKGEGTREGTMKVVTSSGTYSYDVVFSGESGSPVSYKLKEGS